MNTLRLGLFSWDGHLILNLKSELWEVTGSRKLHIDELYVFCNIHILVAGFAWLVSPTFTRPFPIVSKTEKKPWSFGD